MSPLLHHGFRRASGQAFARTFAIVLALALLTPGMTGPASAQSGPFCSKFDSSLDGFGACSDAPNVTVTRVTDSTGLDPSNPFMKLTDLSGPSRVCSSDPKYTGNWLEKMGGCGQLCYDFKVFNSGVPAGPITPSISLVGSSGGRATYVAGFQVAVGDLTWHHICAPVEDGDAPPAGTGGGHWVVSGGETWHQIITNVTMVQLPIDFTSNPSEVVGYDNICVTDEGCKKPPPPPEIKGCLEGTKVAVACKGGGTYTVTLSGGSFTGDTITLAAQTPGVTVSPSQQSWAPTMTFTLSGGSAGQTVILSANATKAGGGTAPGTDQCCSGEIKIVLPDCPQDKPVDVSIAKTGATSPAQVPYYSFTMTITNTGAAFTGANAITVTDVLPAGMTFNTVAAAPPGDWSCPASVPAGGTLTCTYIGSGPVGTGMIGTLTVSATAGGTAPYPPVENCAAVAVSGGFKDTDATNDTSCVTVKKPGGTAELIVKKEVEYLGPLVMPDLIYPISVTCGSQSQTFNLHDGQTGSLGNIPLNTACQITETPPAPTGACPPGGTAAWTTTFAPPVPVTLTAPVTNVTVHNKLICQQPHEDVPGTLQVIKTVTNETEADLTGMTFPATASCGGASTSLGLTTATPQTVTGLAAGTVCSVSEAVPAPPALGCTSGLYPTWEPASVSPSTATIVAGGIATVTVANKLVCKRGGSIGVTKTVTNNTEADISGTSFPVTLNCSGGSSPLSHPVTLTPGGSASILVAPGLTCTPSETLPPAPTGGCVTGSAPAWGAPVYTPPSVTTGTGAGPTVTVQNTLSCVPSGPGKPGVVLPVMPRIEPRVDRKIACRAPLVPNAKGDACVCRPGTVQRGGKCVVPVSCAAPAFRNEQGTACLCPQGLQKRGNTCVQPPRLNCVAPAVRNEQGTACVCPRGMVKRGNTCVQPRQEGPRVHPGDVIRVVPGLVPRTGGGNRNGGGKGSSSDKPAGVN